MFHSQLSLSCWVGVKIHRVKSPALSLHCFDGLYTIWKADEVFKSHGTVRLARDEMSGCSTDSTTFTVWRSTRPFSLPLWFCWGWGVWHNLLWFSLTFCFFKGMTQATCWSLSVIPYLTFAFVVSQKVGSQHEPTTLVIDKTESLFVLRPLQQVALLDGFTREFSGRRRTFKHTYKIAPAEKTTSHHPSSMAANNLHSFSVSINSTVA